MFRLTPSLKCYLLALLSGASLVFSYAPFNYWFIAPLAIALFLGCLNCKSQSPFKVGLSFGVGWFAAGIHWVHVSIDLYGGMHIVLSLGIMALLIGYLALYPALFAYLLTRFFQKSSWLIAAPAMWGLCEFLRGWVLTGFPWLSMGYGQLDGPLAQWAPIIGEAGVGLVVVLVATILLQLFNKGLLQSLAASKFSPAKLKVILLVALLCAPLLLNSFFQAQHDQRVINTTLVQGNIAQSLRWVPEQDWPTMEKYLDLTEPHWLSDLIIWPEAAIPKLEPLAQEYLQYLDFLAAESETALITGIADYSFGTKQAFNNLIVLGRQAAQGQDGHYVYGHTNRYAKHHLLPIGEFIPLEDWIRGISPLFDLPMSSFTRGDYQQHNLQANGYKVAANICFEILFSQQLLDNLESDTDLMLTVSNDAWFGSSIGPQQHMDIARMRALELGIPVIRATNNGVTGIIDNRGEILAQAPQFTDAVLTYQLPLGRISTLFTQSNGLSYWLLLLSLCAAALKQRHSISRA